MKFNFIGLFCLLLPLFSRLKFKGLFFNKNQMSEFEMQKEKEIKWDIELINTYLNTQMSSLYQSIAKVWDDRNFKTIKVLPETLLRRYIPDENIIQVLSQFEYVVWYIRFEPNIHYRKWKENFKAYMRDQIREMKRRWADPMFIKQQTKNVSEQLKQIREAWANTKDQRYMTKVNKFGQYEKVHRSYKRPIYIGTSTALFQGNFYVKYDDYVWKGETPYLAIDTNKEKFVNKIIRIGAMKEILVELKEIKKAYLNAWIDDDFNPLEPQGVDIMVNKIIELLSNPVKQILEEEDDEISKEEFESSLEIIDLDDDTI